MKIPDRFDPDGQLVPPVRGSKEKIEQALVSLGKEELSDMILQKEETEVTCEFCRKVWKLTKGDLERLRTEIGT
jgi:hypothetical protein